MSEIIISSNHLISFGLRNKSSCWEVCVRSRTNMIKTPILICFFVFSHKVYGMKIKTCKKVIVTAHIEPMRNKNHFFDCILLPWHSSKLPNECNHCLVYCNAIIFERVESYSNGKSWQCVSVESAGNLRKFCRIFFAHQFPQPARCLELCFCSWTAIFWPFSAISCSSLWISQSAQYKRPFFELQRSNIKSPILLPAF